MTSGASIVTSPMVDKSAVLRNNLNETQHRGAYVLEAQVPLCHTPFQISIDISEGEGEGGGANEH